MAHLAPNFTSFETFMNLAESVYTVDLAALNSSGVTGNAVVALGGVEEDGAQYVNVAITVDGIEPNQPVPQHIHGLFDEDGNPANSTAPDIFGDTDRDGMVEVLEGVPSYGDVLMPLVDGEGGAPMTQADGSFVYVMNFDINDGDNFFSPVTMTDYDGADILPLELREIVLHGVAVPSGIGAGTGGEVNGDQDGFVALLPAAAGEIEAATLDQALAYLADQRGRAGITAELGDGGEVFDGGIGDDNATGGAGDDRLNGSSGNDALKGGAGDDGLRGETGDDMLWGGDGNDNLAASDGDDQAWGGMGDDMLGGGLGDDLLHGDAGDDTMGGGQGDDSADGGDGDDIVNGGDGMDMLHGGEGADTMGAGAGDDEVTGDAGNDSLGGGMGNDMLRGGDGDDRIGGGAGDDNAGGGDGNDFVAGGAGNDMLHGDDGDDTLNGGTGNDTLEGGDGDDTFVFNHVVDGETDVIDDFEAGEDLIVVRGYEPGLDGVTLQDLEIDGEGFVQVGIGGHTILLEDTSVMALSDGDFMFV